MSSTRGGHRMARAGLGRSFVSNDVVSLVLGVPLLLVTLRLAHRGRPIGLLLWPGALLYATYNYIAYAAATTTAWQLVLFLAVAGMSGWAVIRLLTRIAGTARRRRAVGIESGVLRNHRVVPCR